MNVPKFTSTRNYKQRRAISNGITTLALIGLAVAVVAGVAMAYASAQNNVKGGLQVAVQESRLVKSSNGATWSIVLKNPGNVAISSTTATLLDVPGPTLAINTGAISPGQTASGVNTNIPASIVVGTTYRITISATGADGSNTSTTFNVVAESG